MATDNGAATRTSAAVSVTVSNPTSPVTRAQFTASADHATLVVRYVLEVLAAGANPNTATPLASQIRANRRWSTAAATWISAQTANTRWRRARIRQR